MRRPLITFVIAAALFTACSSSAAKSSNNTSAVPTTTGPVTTTSVAEGAQSVPVQTRYVVDGNNVDLICKGHGNIPIVFLAGGRENGVVWNQLVASLGNDVFACVFNRSGTTAEDVNQAIGHFTTASVVANELAGTLQQAGVGPRVILVGHSAGGTDAVVFGNQHPDLVAGAVLFDPSVPDLVPADEWKRVGYDGAATVRDAQAVKSWPDVPLIVLTADSKLAVKNQEATPADEQKWIAGHKRWARLSSEGAQREVPGTNHLVYLTAPTAARDAVREVLDRAD